MLSVSTFGQETQKAKEGKGTTAWKTYGAELTQKEITPLAKVLKNIEKYRDKVMLVEGTITEVCQNKGCWMMVDDKGTQVRVEFNNYGFFVPWDSEGKKVRLQGTVRRKKISEKMAEHMAAEMKKPPVEMGKKGEQEITVFIASGVAIEGGSEISEEQRAIIEGKKTKEGQDHKKHQH